MPIGWYIYRDANMIIIEDKIRDHMPEQGANVRHRSPKRHFLAINKLEQSYDYTSTLFKRRCFLQLKKDHGPSFALLTPKYA